MADRRRLEPRVVKMQKIVKIEKFPKLQKIFDFLERKNVNFNFPRRLFLQNFAA